MKVVGGWGMRERAMISCRVMRWHIWFCFLSMPVSMAVLFSESRPECEVLRVLLCVVVLGSLLTIPANEKEGDKS